MLLATVVCVGCETKTPDTVVEDLDIRTKTPPPKGDKGTKFIKPLKDEMEVALLAPSRALKRADQTAEWQIGFEAGTHYCETMKLFPIFKALAYRTSNTDLVDDQEKALTGTESVREEAVSKLKEALLPYDGENYDKIKVREIYAGYAQALYDYGR